MFLHQINIKEGLDSEEPLDCSQCPPKKGKKLQYNNELLEKINNLSTQVNLISGQLKTTTETSENNKNDIAEINAKIKKFQTEITRNMKKESRR